MNFCCNWCILVNSGWCSSWRFCSDGNSLCWMIWNCIFIASFICLYLFPSCSAFHASSPLHSFQLPPATLHFWSILPTWWTDLGAATASAIHSPCSLDSSQTRSEVCGPLFRTRSTKQLLWWRPYLRSYLKHISRNACSVGLCSVQKRNCSPRL